MRERKFLGCDNVLCLSPHPDDVEYGMLGTMMEYPDTNFFILTISIGGKFDSSSGNDRREECKQIWNVSHNISGEFLLDGHAVNFNYDELVHAIESRYNINSFDMILIPSADDTHHDHKKINVVGMALTRKSRCSIIEYKTPSTLETWVPNYFVHIPIDTLEAKIDLLQHFKTQTKHLYFTPNVLKSFHINYQCSRRGIEYVEMFRIHRLYH